MSNTGKNSAKSAVSGNRKAGSPAGKATAASALAVTEPKKQKLTLWPEWNENDINAEKWEGLGKTKDAKAKPTSAPASQGFEDTDPKFDWPYSIQSKIDCFKRPSEIFEKIPQVVDSENGIENFDLITPNEHLHNSETIRWIISQIHTLWDICKKEIKPGALTSASPSQAHESEPITNKAFGAGRLWRPWEHIYAINKVVKGPFIPIYNPYGKYVVRLYFMGAWRKIIIDDLMPVDEKGMLLLPQTTITGEIWPLLLTKALLKIMSLDFNPADSATEFNDVSIISCFTGWLPEPLPLRFGHITEVWKFLKETLPKFSWIDEKQKVQSEEEQILITDSNELKEDVSTEKDAKTDKSLKVGNKPKSDVGKASGKDTKLDKHKKDTKDKKGKSIVDEQLLEENFIPDFPDMVVFASFTDLPLNKLSASTEVADRRERLRKYNLNHDFSNPCWITCTRDIPLNPPPPPEIIPVWKTIRQRKKHVVPSDEPILAAPPKQDQFIELKSPFVGYKAQPTLPIIHTGRAGSRFSKMRSRPQTAITGIEEMDEKNLLENLKSESPTELNKINLDIEKEQDPLNSSIKPPPSSKAGSKTAPDSVKSNSFVKKDREKSVEGLDKQNAKNVISTSKLDDGPNSIKTSKSIEKHGLTGDLGAINQSANGIGLDHVEKSFLQDHDSKLADKSKLWMDFDDFFICFKSIVVYHKPTSFKNIDKYSDLRQVMPQQKADKKKETNTINNQAAPLLDEKSPKLLFVDSLMPIELIVSFSSLSRWYEQKLEQPEKIVKSSKKNESLVVEHDAMSVAETIKEITPLQAGYLMAEPYSWKSLVTGQPLLRIHTTAIRSSFLSLPPGRHVLRFLMHGPIGYHINILSNTPFSFGDEEEIMPKLIEESSRFIDQALHIVKCLSDATKSFVESDKQNQSIDLLYASISPLTDAYLNNSVKNDEKISKRNLLETFQLSLYEMLKKTLGDSVDPEMAFAWRVFLFDFVTPDILSLKERRPETGSTNRGSAKKIDKEKEKEKEKEKSKKNEPTTGKSDKNEKQNTAASITLSEKAEKESNDERLEYWKNHQANAGEHIATVKLQAAWRGFYTRKMIQSREPGTEKNLQVFEQLKKALHIIEQNSKENALFLFRTMFKINPSIMQFYSFYKDEWNRISYFDYNGSYLDQVSNSWFILFRDVFYASEEVLLLPKLYCNLNNCLLKVINNDTYKEIPKVFNKVSPYTYTKNKRGYTIIAESRIQDQPVSPGRWRLRLIGNSPSLILPHNNKTDIISTFDVRDTRDYYIPNEKKLILRYKVTVSEDHLLSIQLTTSKPDVYLKFTIYDGDKEILSVNGKGTAVIPAFIFLKDRGEITGDALTTSRPNSKTFSSGRTSKNVVDNKDTKSSVKRRLSATSNEIGKQHNTANSRSSSRASNNADIDEEEQNSNHEYYIEAKVLKDSWPLSPSQWSFINNLKENEAAELKVFSKDRALSPSKESKANSNESKGAALKAAKAKAQKKGTPAPPTTSRPASSAFDSNKPHWILKWVSDATCADAIEIKKDTDRIDKIKALKRAWESHEAGRAAKATIARAEFLKTHLVKVDGSATDDEGEKTADDEAQANPTLPAVADPKTNTQPSIKVSDTNTKLAKSSKQSVEDVKTPKAGKGKDSKKEKTDPTKPSQEPITQMSDHANESVIIDEPLSNRPPTPPKPKVYLPPLDVAPFTRTSHMGVIIKDENFEKEQARLRKMEMDNFLQFKDQINKFREDERKYRLQQKIKQIEECENLQYKLDLSRKEVYEPREAFRQLFLDAERKRLEDLAGQEAILAATQKIDPKDNKKKGSAGKGKKK